MAERVGRVSGRLCYSNPIISLEDLDEPVITVLDDATPYVVRKYIEHVPMHERVRYRFID